MAKQNRKVNMQPFWRFLFVLYCGVMLWLLFGRSQGWTAESTYRQMLLSNLNLTPLLTIRNYYHVVLQGPDHPYFIHCVINLLGNVLLFIPAGYLIPKVFPRQQHLLLFFFTCAGLILLVETVQLITLLGSFDVDDVILNLSGMLCGFIVYHICAGIKRR